jgi:DNA ligase (NAD+)
MPGGRAFEPLAETQMAAIVRLAGFGFADQPADRLCADAEEMLAHYAAIEQRARHAGL